jgi:hypothetical protein
MVGMQDDVGPGLPAQAVPPDREYRHIAPQDIAPQDLAPQDLAPQDLKRHTAVPYGQVVPQAPTWLAPQLSTPQLLRPPEPDLARILNARVQRGYTPEGFDSPRGKLWVAGVLPSSAGTVIAAITALVSSGVTETVATALTVAFAVTAASLVGFIRGDRLRLRTAQRRRLNENRTWHSHQPWHHVPTDGVARLLISRAQQAVGQIVTSPAWATAEFDDHRARLDLAAELDEIDAQAFNLARLTPPPVELTTLTARVDALCAYAAAVSTQPGDATTAPDPQSRSAAVVGGVRDEYATDHLRALTEDVRRR